MLKGKNAIVTGARRGIGRATVEAFAENGANIWACARSKEDAFEKDMKILAARCGVWIEPVYFDLIDEEQIKEALKTILQQKKPIDILVNNAGMVQIASLQMTSLKIMKALFQVNFFSQILIMQLISRTMMRQKSGSIVNISSVAGLDGDEATLAYGSSKAALAYASRTASKDLAPYKIRVNAVAPGMVETDMAARLPKAAQDNMNTRIALQRIALPSEIADVVTFLASDKAAYITGQIIRVDGGI